VHESGRPYREKKKLIPNSLPSSDLWLIDVLDKHEFLLRKQRNKQALVTHNGVEEGGLADVGQPDNSCAEAHANPCRAAGGEPPGAAGPAPLPVPQ